MARKRWHSLTATALALSGGIAVLLAAAFAFSWLAVGNLRDAGRQALRSQEALTAGSQLEKSVVNLENGLRGYVASGRESFLEPFNSARKQYPAQVDRLSELLGDDPELQARLGAIEEEISDYVDLWAVPLLSVARDDIEVARSVIVNKIGTERVSTIRSQFRALERAERQVATRRERSAERRADLARAMGIVGIILVITLTAGLAWLLRRAILRPLSSIGQATDRVATGDLTARVAEDRDNEIGELARAFNAMTASLERNREELSRRTSELERSNRELEDYASVTSHDLQGPLVTVGMYAEMLCRRLDDDPDARQLAQHIQEGAAGMRQLVRDLLAYSRIGRTAPIRVPVDLGESLQDALDALAGPIRERDVEITTRPLPVVIADPGQCRQLLQNLVANAVKFADDTPRVTISSRIDGEMGEVIVADNGIGLAPEQAEIIFRPFHRLHDSDTYEGTGLGLAVCHKIVTNHGGRIWADGTPGEGARFHFTLPLAAEGVPEPEPVMSGAA